MQNTISGKAADSAITRRKILYLSGYDPRGAGHYHALYKTEAAKESERGKNPIQVSARKRNGRFSSSWKINNGNTATDYEFLSWDDLIRKNWLRHPLVILMQTVLIYGNYFLTGTVLRIFSISKTRFFGLIFPLLLLLLLGLFCVVIAISSAVLITNLLPYWYVAWPAGMLLAYISYIYLGGFLEKRYNIYWLLRAYYFFMLLSKERVDGLDDRVDEYARHLLKVLNDNSNDEVLLVGHSTGSILLTMVLNRALQIDPQLRQQLDRLALLTVGHVIQDATLFPRGEKVRLAVRNCIASGIYWLNVTAPPDGACFPLVDVATGSGIDPETDTKNRRAISARFHKMLTPEHYRKLKRDRLKLHFQYLMAGDLDSEYNYYSITSGPMSLRQRYGKASG